MKKYDLEKHITVVSGDFLKELLSKAEIICMNMILHNWNLEIKKIIKAAFDALPPDGIYCNRNDD